MRVALQTCQHKRVNWYRNEDPVHHGTCETCYRRLQFNSDDPYTRPYDDFPWDGLCGHQGDRVALMQLNKKNGPRALCLLCGVVLEHPDGPGTWEEVVFSRYEISEEP